MPEGQEALEPQPDPEVGAEPNNKWFYEGQEH